jgi:hypothetical protein
VLGRGREGATGTAGEEGSAQQLRCRSGGKQGKKGVRYGVGHVPGGGAGGSERPATAGHGGGGH